MTGFDPVVLCFVAGLAAGILRSDLRLPEALYETLSIYLLLAIGLKGGVQLSQTRPEDLIAPAAATLLLGLTIPIIAYAILRKVGGLGRADSAAIAAHYGSVSAVTFAVVLGYLHKLNVAYEEFVTVLLVILEIPAIAVGILIARIKTSTQSFRWGNALHEVFVGKSIYLLLAGLIIGCLAGPAGIRPVEPLFMDLFKGVLALFLLEMGIVTSKRLKDLKRTGVFLTAFAIGMPIVSGLLGTGAGVWTGLSIGGTTVLATLAASASYIAAPAAMRIAVPQANPTLYLTASLGITFPFNIVVGIPLYYRLSQWAHAFGG